MQITLELPANLQIRLTNAAEQQHLSLNEYIIQCLLQNPVIQKQPNRETRHAIEDARAGKNMRKISLEELKKIADA